MSGDFTQSDVIKLIDKIESDGNYYNKLITHQNEMLQKWAIDYPMDMLKSEVKLKEKEMNKKLFTSYLCDETLSYKKY